MIKDDEIKIKVNSRILKKLINNEYKVNIGDIVYIDINLLPLKSHIKIDCICDNCRNATNIKYQDYNKITNNNAEKYFCKKCKILKIKNSKKEIYGDEYFNNREKSIKTILEKYGCENVSQIENVKDKKRKTCLKNYNVEIPSQSNIILSKMKNTCIEKYGFENPAQSEKIKNKMKNTCIEKYGVNHPFRLEKVRNKSKITLIKRYGVDHPMKNESIFNKQRSSAFSVKKNNGLFYQGTYELDFILFCLSENIKIHNGPVITYNGNHKYYPDFLIPKFNLIIEIKSLYTYEKELEKNIQKKEACLLNGYNFIFIVDKNYKELIELCDI